MRFLLDENLPPLVAAALREYGHDVLDVADSAHRGRSDADLWQLAIEEQRIIVTRDLDFPLTGAEGRPPGLVILRLGSTARALHIDRVFRAFLSAVDVASLVGAVTTVEPSRVRQRPFSALNW